MNLDLRKYGTSFTKQDIQDALSELGASYTDITHVYIVDYAEIPDRAFEGWVNLELVYGLYRCVSIGQRAFCGCRKLANNDISSCETIGEGAFENCGRLTTMKIKPGVAIPASCFHQCSSLRIVYNLSQCTSIGNGAFYECRALAITDVSKSNSIGRGAFFGCTGLVTIKIKPGISIGMCAFQNCTNLEFVYNLNQCTSLGTECGSFMGCSKLRNTSIENCNEVSYNTFEGCTSLTQMKLKPGATIRSYAFNGCTNLSKVYNLNTAQYIGEYAFMNCSSLDQTIDLQRLQIGNLGHGAFVDAGERPFHVKLGTLASDTNITNYFNQYNIKYVTIQPNEHIPDYMFAWCYNLEFVYNLDTACEIGASAFYSCGKLSNSKLLSCSSIGSYAFMGCSTVAFSNLPAAPVIGEYAFWYCDSITKMTINGGTVGMSAFKNCDNLSKVTLVNASVSDSAFAECDNLEKVEMRGYANILNGVFYDCPKLSEVTLGTETFGIGGVCFAGCSNLKKIYNLGVVSSINEIGGWFLAGVNLEHNTIAANATAMCSNTLSGCNMPEWNLPNVIVSDVKSKNGFGANAGTVFKCKDGEVVIEASMPTILFDDGTCVQVTNSGPWLSKDDLVSAGVMTPSHEWINQPTRVILGDCYGIENDVFANCHKLSYVNMTSAAGVGARVFANCTSLKEISGDYMPDGFGNVGSYAFQGCTNLSRIKLNTSNIHEGAFEGCVSLSSVSFISYYHPVMNIGSRAFAGCVGLKSITVPSNTTQIQDEAFAGSGLATVNINSSTALTIDNGSGQFKNCANLTTVTLPSSGCEIPDECFMNCSRLQTAYNLYKCTDIGDYAFFGCSALTNKDVSKCDSIGDHAFQGCTSIPQIKVKSGSSVGDYSFMGCGGIETMYNLSYVGSIGNNALYGLSLSHNTIRALDSGLTSKSLSGCFNESWNLPNIYVAEAEAKNWYGANKGVTLNCKDGTIVSDNQDSYTTINGTDKVLLKGIVDAESLIDAGYDIDSIATIEFGTGVTSIGNSGFEGCSELTNVTIPDSVTSIGYDSFAYTGLTSVTICDGVMSIGSAAFYGCSGLTGVTIPSSVISVGIDAFSDCSGLTNLTFLGKTLEQVQGMANYSWGVNSSIIHVG